MNKLFSFLGTPTNLISSGVTLGAVTAATLMSGNPAIILGAAALSYTGTLLLTSPKPLQYIEMGGVGKEPLERNVQVLSQQVEDHRKDLPGSIITQVETVLTTITQVLPKWQSMDSFVEQQHTVNAIVTEYIPNILNSYLELPKSYLDRSRKTVEVEITTQLNLLQSTMNDIEDAVYAGVEKQLEQQRMFLEQKFNRNTTLTLG